MKNNSTNEDYILECYRSMNTIQKERLLKYIDLLTSKELLELFGVCEKKGRDRELIAS